MKLSIVIPVYYNEDNLIPLYEDIQKKIIQVIDYEYEIVMVKSWKKGSNVVLAVRKDRDEAASQKLFANLYYFIVRKTSLPSMPKGGFDVYLLDRKVIRVLEAFDEKNSALTGQILWSGFKTDIVYYTRLAREVGSSKWTLRKKIRLVMDTLFSFSTLPISIVLSVGICSFLGAMIWLEIYQLADGQLYLFLI